jgi:DEP domain-containing protein 5
LEERRYVFGPSIKVYIITEFLAHLLIYMLQVSSAYLTSHTKTIFRSLSARATIFIQVCRELWSFAGDGERYTEKIVSSFLPALFARWRDSGTTHVVTIVLISRVHYDASEVSYAAGPLLRDNDGVWYKDFFKVITDLEVCVDWKPTLVGLKDSFWAFQRDILLAHHYHRATLFPAWSSAKDALPASTSAAPADSGNSTPRLVGQLSYAHDGPILEALNLSLHPLETHYIDRSLSLTGTSTVVITPGTGYFRVDARLLRLTTRRLSEQGIGVELVCLCRAPLYMSPVFAFRGEEEDVEGEAAPDSARGSRGSWEEGYGGPKERSGQGGLVEKEGNAKKKTRLYWWEPTWMSVSFWDRQMDLPFREDR